MSNAMKLPSSCAPEPYSSFREAMPFFPPPFNCGSKKDLHFPFTLPLRSKFHKKQEFHQPKAICVPPALGASPAAGPLLEFHSAFRL